VVASADLETVLADLKKYLEKRESLRANKAEVHKLVHIMNSLDKVVILVATLGDSELPGDVLECVATKFNHLNFCISKYKAITLLVDELQPRLNAIGHRMHQSLEPQLLAAAQTDALAAEV